MSRNKQRKPQAPARRTESVALSARGVRSSVLCDLAADRAREAEILLSHAQFTGAAYIAGHAVELLLKAVIAVRRGGGYWATENILAEYRTHNLEVLLDSAGLREQMRRASEKNFELGSNWQIIRGWGPDLRYRRLQKGLASDIVIAVTEERDGVGPWLRLWAS